MFFDLLSFRSLDFTFVPWKGKRSSSVMKARPGIHDGEECDQRDGICGNEDEHLINLHRSTTTCGLA